MMSVRSGGRTTTCGRNRADRRQDPDPDRTNRRQRPRASAYRLAERLRLRVRRQRRLRGREMRIDIKPAADALGLALERCRPAGAAGFLRRRSATHPARPRRHQGHGPLSRRRAPVARGARQHARQDPGRRRGPVRLRGGGGDRPGRLEDQTREPQPRHQRDDVARRDRHLRRRRLRRARVRRDARRRTRACRRTLLPRRVAGGPGRGVRQPPGGVSARAVRDLRAAGDSSQILRAAADHHERHPARVRRRRG